MWNHILSSRFQNFISNSYRFSFPPKKPFVVSQVFLIVHYLFVLRHNHTTLFILGYRYFKMNMNGSEYRIYVAFLLKPQVLVKVLYSFWSSLVCLLAAVPEESNRGLYFSHLYHFSWEYYQSISYLFSSIPYLLDLDWSDVTILNPLSLWSTTFLNWSEAVACSDCFIFDVPFHVSHP